MDTDTDCPFSIVAKTEGELGLAKRQSIIARKIYFKKCRYGHCLEFVVACSTTFWLCRQPSYLGRIRLFRLRAVRETNLLSSENKVISLLSKMKAISHRFSDNYSTHIWRMQPFSFFL